MSDPHSPSSFQSLALSSSYPVLTIIPMLVPTLVYGQLVGGTIAGDVVDPSTPLCPGARVTIRNQETGGIRELMTAPGGRFSGAVDPRRHLLRFSLTGWICTTQADRHCAHRGPEHTTPSWP